MEGRRSPCFLKPSVSHNSAVAAGQSWLNGLALLPSAFSFVPTTFRSVEVGHPSPLKDRSEGHLR